MSYATHIVGWLCDLSSKEIQAIQQALFMNNKLSGQSDNSQRMCSGSPAWNQVHEKTYGGARQGWPLPIPALLSVMSDRSAMP